MNSRPQEKQTIIIACGGTGGHLFPGIAVAQELLERGHHPILLISRKEVDAEASGKYGELEFRSVPAIAKPPIFSLRMPGFIYKLWSTYRSCKKLIQAEKASAVLGMGGFTSLPPVRAARKLGLRSYVHDSNALPGKANRMTARWCNKVLVGMEVAASFFPKSDCVATGTPVRAEMNTLPDKATAREALGLAQNIPVILIIGGSQGARNLNTTLVEAAKEQPEVHYLIIAGKSDCERVQNLATGASNITVLGFCADMPAAYAAADGVVARSGASTLTELASIGKATLLVPFPYAADDHQTHNARVFSSVGAAELCRQSELKPDTVCKFVQKHVLDTHAREVMETAMRSLSRPDAAKTIADIILE